MAGWKRSTTRTEEILVSEGTLMWSFIACGRKRGGRKRGGRKIGGKNGGRNNGGRKRGGRKIGGENGGRKKGGMYLNLSIIVSNFN